MTAQWVILTYPKTERETGALAFRMPFLGMFKDDLEAGPYRNQVSNVGSRQVVDLTSTRRFG